MKTNKFTFLTIGAMGLIFALSASGCSSSTSADAVKKANDDALAQIRQQQAAHPTNVQATINQQAAYINNSAVPEADKAQTIAEMKAKTEAYYASLHGGPPVQ